MTSALDACNDAVAELARLGVFARDYIMATREQIFAPRPAHLAARSGRVIDLRVALTVDPEYIDAAACAFRDPEDADIDIVVTSTS